MQELWTKDEWAAPAVILMEVYPQALLRNGYKGGVPALPDRLLASGYADILHSGCGSGHTVTSKYDAPVWLHRQAG